jgi:tyrosine-specific transport protein
LQEAFNQGLPATWSLSKIRNAEFIAPFAHLFAFLALVTSFFGIGMGLFDFLSDGLKIKKEGTGFVVLGLLVLLPSLFFALYFERVFIAALDISGGFGDTLLNGVLPLLMLGVGYYKFTQKKLSSFQYLFLGVLTLLYFVAFSIEAKMRFF